MFSSLIVYSMNTGSGLQCHAFLRINMYRCHSCLCCTRCGILELYERTICDFSLSPGARVIALGLAMRSPAFFQIDCNITIGTVTIPESSEDTERDAVIDEAVLGVLNDLGTGLKLLSSTLVEVDDHWCN